MMTRRALADAIDDLDEQISDLQTAKAETFAAYREQLKGQGSTKEQAKIEIEATKVAIRQRRQIREDVNAYIERDSLTEAILDEIRVDKSSKLTHARALAPARGEAA